MKGPWRSIPGSKSSFKRVGGWFSGPKSLTRHVTKGFSDLGRGAYKYIASPQHSFIYGSGDSSGNKGWSIGNVVRSGHENLETAGKKLGYWGSAVIGQEKKSSIGKEREGARARAESLAAENARRAMLEAEVLEYSAGGAMRTQRNRRRGTMSNMAATQTPIVSGDQLGTSSSLGA